MKTGPIRDISQHLSASVSSFMDLSSKIPFQRDWENLSLFSRKEGEISKHAQQSDWEVVDNHGSYGNGNGSVYSSGGGLGPGSDLGNGSSRSSISSSIGFPSKAGTGALGFIIDLVEKPPEILKENKDLAMVETEILHRVVAVDGPKEPRTQLKLGKRTYFEGGIHITNSSSLASTNPSIGLVKKPKVSQQTMQSSHCQVEGCNVDLSAAKDYHRKHRVCESHSKSPKVIVAGQTCRFCQQCSRFHDLSEFDQKKRSCRRRLSDHNARRRKPQPGTIGLGSSVLSASYYATDDRQRMNLIFGRAPFNHVAYMANSTWDDSAIKYQKMFPELTMNGTGSCLSRAQMRRPPTKVLEHLFLLLTWMEHWIFKMLSLFCQLNDHFKESETRAGDQIKFFEAVFIRLVFIYRVLIIH
ncbi:hypothetical protein OPV22_023577 [Ensete ventricosum]|uniref:SBP-type domain-containing protein n=1 Tax=Ensete ventricosum TaxID=4639 RepID=A0AAV8QNW6_ENSVE|nr:hypothetical protein OPV22_023577 [Ensete ventricosum]